jgi:transketolase
METKIKEIKRLVLNASFEAGACHIGSALSCIPKMVELHYNILKKDDVFLFSKASGVATYYAILCDKGYFSREYLPVFLKNYPLPSTEVPGVVHSFGSLGHGLPVAVGMALGNRNKNVHVLMSDGEVQEGTTFESALFARQHKLDNLFVYIDDNKIQGLDYTDKILNLDTAYEFLKATLPHLEILDTKKGAGIDFMSDDAAWHYRNLTPELLAQALAQV